MNEVLIKLIDNLAQIGLFLASVVGTIITIFTFRRAGRAETTAAASVKQSTENTAKLDAVHKDVNGKMQELVDMTGRAKFREGVKSEKDLNATKAASYAEGKADTVKEQETPLK